MTTHTAAIAFGRAWARLALELRRCIEAASLRADDPTDLDLCRYDTQTLRRAWREIAEWRSPLRGIVGEEWRPVARALLEEIDRRNRTEGTDLSAGECPAREARRP